MFQGGNSMNQGPSESPKSNLSEAALEVLPVLTDIHEILRDSQSDGQSLISAVNDLISKKMSGEDIQSAKIDLELNLKISEEQVLSSLREKFAQEPDNLDKKTTIVRNFFRKLKATF